MRRRRMPGSTTPGIEAIEALVQPYSSMDWLECDGLGRVLHAVLKQHGIAHTLYMGTVINTSTGAGHGEHYWIVLPTHGRMIDYRATWWVSGNDVPYGIFDPTDYPHMDYQPLVIEEAVLSPTLIEELLTPSPRRIDQVTVRSLSEWAAAALARYQLVHDGTGERTLPLPAMTRALPIRGTQNLALFFSGGDFLVLDRSSGHLMTAAEASQQV
jgi:hypothetical protein